MIDISLTKDIESCLAVRHKVFVEEQGIALEEDVDGLDEEAIQFLVRDGDQPVGTLRILVKDTTAKIGRLAVLKSHRGRGLGRDLMLAALEHLQAQDHLTKVKLGAQIEAIGLYESLGFRPEGDTFMDAGLPHQMMVRAL